MAKRQHVLTCVESGAKPISDDTGAFSHHVQAGLLLSLLHRSLLAQFQYEHCMEELTRRGRYPPQSYKSNSRGGK